MFSTKYLQIVCLTFGLLVLPSHGYTKQINVGLAIGFDVLDGFGADMGLRFQVGKNFGLQGIYSLEHHQITGPDVGPFNPLDGSGIVDAELLNMLREALDLLASFDLDSTISIDNGDPSIGIVDTIDIRAGSASTFAPFGTQAQLDDAAQNGTIGFVGFFFTAADIDGTIINAGDLPADALQRLPLFTDVLNTSLVLELTPGGSATTTLNSTTTTVVRYRLELDSVSASVVSVPAAAWLFGSGLIGLVSIARRKKAA